MNYKEAYMDLIGYLENQEIDGQALYDNMKDEGLDLGALEAEGFLRAIKSVRGYLADSHDKIEDYKPSFNVTYDDISDISNAIWVLRRFVDRQSAVGD